MVASSHPTQATTLPDPIVNPHRGFNLSHQKVSVDVSLALGVLSGITELTIVPTSGDLRTLFLNFRQGRVKQVSVYSSVRPPDDPLDFSSPTTAAAATVAEFTHNDPLASLSLSKPTDIHTFPEAKRKAFAAFAEGEQGELAIRLKPSLLERHRRDPSLMTEDEKRADARRELENLSEKNGILIIQPAGTKVETITLLDFVPLIVRIEWEVACGGEGLAWFGRGGDNDWHVPHIYTTPTTPDAARCWLPCVDNMWERCTWELDFIVPRRWVDDPSYGKKKRQKGKDRARGILAGDEERGEGEGRAVVVACSGDLVEHVSHPSVSTKSIFRFVQSIPTTVQHITFAVGPFEVLTLPPTPNPPPTNASAANPSATSAANPPSPLANLASMDNPIPAEEEDIEPEAADVQEDDPSSSSQPPMHIFTLPGTSHLLQHSTAFLRKAMSFYSAEYGSYPYSSYNLVFVDEPLEVCTSGAGMAIANVDLLFPEDVIDQAYETRHLLAHALAFQWVGINIIPKMWSDTWLINGLGLYITGQFMRKLLGNNEYRFRLKMDRDRCARMDNGSQLPICMPGSTTPPDATILPFLNLKSALVLFILDRRLGKTGTSLGLSRVIPKIFLSALTGELTNNVLSTQAFFRMCRKISGVDTRAFAEQWVWGSGSPRFDVTAVFNKKKMLVEMTVRQKVPAKDFEKDDLVRESFWKPTRAFEGQMTVRIHEADGTPYEHVLDIREGFKTYDVPFNTKYKRVRRNTKRYLARKAAAAAAAAGDADAAEAMGMLDLGFDLAIWEDEKERERWRVADWTEEEENTMVGAPYEWIRLDADFEWIAEVVFDQPSFYWVNQLQRDRDVVAQVEAIHALRNNPTPVVTSTLGKTVLVTNYFYRVRMEAADALQVPSHKAPKNDQDHLGLFLLFKIFQSRYCYPPLDGEEPMDHTAFRCIPKPNDFSDFAEYFVRKAVLIALSRYVQTRGSSREAISWPVVRQFLVDLLKYNDNSINKYSDSSYVATIIACLGYCLVLTASVELGGASPAAADLSKPDHRTSILLLEQAADQVDRYMEMDRLVPSFHNVVTLAGLEWKIKATLANLIPNDVRLFLVYTREGNYIPVRLTAFDCLLLCLGPASKAEVASYIFRVITKDLSRLVRRHVASALSEAFIIALSVGSVKLSHTPVIVQNSAEADGGGSGAVSGDGGPGGGIKSKVQVDEVESSLKALKKEIGRSAVMREGIMGVIASPEVDFDVRWSMIQLADMLVRPAEETMPKLVIHLQPTPAVEPTTPMLTPRIKLFAGNAPPTPVQENIEFASAIPTNPLKVVIPRQGSQETIKVKKKKEKPKPVIKACRSGLSEMDLVACRSMLRKLETHKSSAYFRIPVDPVRDSALDYFAVVKNPMDLSTVKAKLEDGQYPNRFAFATDVRLIPSNSMHYNQPGSHLYKLSEKFDAYFEKQWEILNNVLSANGDGGPVVPAVPTPAPTPTVTAAPVTSKVSIKKASTINGQPVASMPPPPLPASVTLPKSTMTAITPLPRPIIKLKTNTTPLATSTDLPAGPSPAIPSVPPLAATAGSNNAPVPVEGNPQFVNPLAKEKKSTKQKVKIMTPSSTPGPVSKSTPSLKVKAVATTGVDDLLDEELGLLMGSSPPPATRPSNLPVTIQRPPSPPSVTTGPPFSSQAPSSVKGVKLTSGKIKLKSVESPASISVKPKLKEPEMAKIKLKEPEVAKIKLKTPDAIASNLTSTSAPTPETSKKLKIKEVLSTTSIPSAPASSLEPAKKFKLKSKTSANTSPAPAPDPGLVHLAESLSKSHSSPAPRPSLPSASSIPSFSQLPPPPPPPPSLLLPPLTNSPGMLSPLPPPPLANQPLSGSFDSSSSYPPDRPMGSILPPAIPKARPSPTFHKNKDRIIVKRARTLIQSVLRVPAAFIFAQPVDPERDGCPTYYDEIKRPMDFATMDNKLSKGKYVTWGDFGADIELIFANCRQFNPPGTGPTEWADLVEDHVRKVEWPRATLKEILPEEKKELSGIISKLIRWHGSEWFRDPVDVVALNIPDYPNIITQPRSLSVIKQNVQSNPLYNYDLFETDMHLVIDNAKKYNGPDSAVGQAATRLENYWRSIDSEGSKKRKDASGGSSGGGGQMKKVKR
ncbi:TATA binding protein associated factor [Phaffia rhodozyma]|uniref:Transcription initiation factor TFIID subunit 2 n=1 Tax=Phaffia rhodozyma TaxID=264483 RepID=A0A0F7SEJ3_PHARH|nr:TATA binding protein associated factor [Phaffia rhodozyma]